MELSSALRSLARRRGFSLLVIATLALTLGCVAAVLTLTEAVLLRPLPFPKPDELVLLFRGTTTTAGRGSDLSPGNCASLEDARIFRSMACWMRSSRTARYGTSVETVGGALIQPHLFDVLHVPLALGRKFQPSETIPGSDRVLIITHEYWQRAFSGAPDILGREISLDEKTHTIIGVLPPKFRLYEQNTEYFAPLALTPTESASQAAQYVQAVARLHPTGTLASAQSETSKLVDQLVSQFPVDNRAMRINVIPMQQDLTRAVRGPIQLLLLTTFLLMAIGLANLTNLFLTRTQQRSSEIAIRRSLGATQWHLILSIITEPILLCTAGGALGLLLASWSLSILKLLVPSGLTTRITLELGWPTLIAMALLVMIAAAAMSLPAAFRATRASNHRTVIQTQIGRTQFALLAFEVACALVLVISSNLLVESWREATRTPLGMNPDNLLLATIPPPNDNRLPFYDRVLDAISQRPGVQSVAYASAAPLTWRGGNLRFRIDGTHCEPGSCVTLYREVSADYFKTLEIPLKSGRFLGREDRETSEPVAVINETFARRFFGGRDPIGQRIELDRASGHWMRIVGIVTDTREMGLEAPPRQTIYIPHRQTHQTFAPPVTVMVRAQNPNAAILHNVTTQPVSNIMTMQTLLAGLNQTRTLQSQATSFFAFTALAMAGLGLYGILAYMLTLRRREMGIRIALGASAATIVSTFTRGPAIAITAGLTLGAAASWFVVCWIEPLLLNVKIASPLPYAISIGILMFVGIVACLKPASDAMSIPPAEALRQI